MSTSKSISEKPSPSIGISHESWSHFSKTLSSLAHRIADIACEIFFAIRDGALFFKRYFGSKTWSLPGLLFRLPGAIIKSFHKESRNGDLVNELFDTTGYHFSFERRLKPEELKEYLPYACATTFAQTSDPSTYSHPIGYQPINPNELNIPSLGSLTAQDYCLFDHTSGLKIVLMENDTEVIIAFGARKSTDRELGDDIIAKDTMNQRAINTLLRQWIGDEPPIYEQANSFFQKAQSLPRLQGKRLVLAGLCYGGSLASFVALKNQKRCFCFNAFPIGAGLQRAIGDDMLKRADEFITHLSAEGDWISDAPLHPFFDKIASFIGIRTPGNFGHRYSIPSAYDTIYGTHVYTLGSMLHYLGKDKKPGSKMKEILHTIFYRTPLSHPPIAYELQEAKK